MLDALKTALFGPPAPADVSLTPITGLPADHPGQFPPDPNVDGRVTTYQPLVWFSGPNATDDTPDEDWTYQELPGTENNNR